MTLVQCAADAARKLEVAGVTADESRRDAVVLARWCLGWSAADWLTRAQQPAPAAFSSAFAAAIDRRARREPLAYITGEREFYGRMFDVTPAVLIPRPETELLVEEALRCLQQIGRQAPYDQVRPQVLDIGTGSGCVAITLALEAPAAAIIATDVSTPALDVARRNARRLKAADRIEFRLATFAENASGVFDLIVANPPYVPESTRESLAPEVREYEPADARYLSNHRGHLMFLRPEEQEVCTAELIRTVTFTGTRPELQARLRELASAGYNHFAIRIAHGHPEMLEEWADVFAGV